MHCNNLLPFSLGGISGLNHHWMAVLCRTELQGLAMLVNKVPLKT